MWITLNNIAYVQQLIAPLFFMVGDVNTANFLLTGTGLFLVTIINLIYSFLTCGFGLKWYAKIQKPAYIAAGIGLVIAIIIYWVAGDTASFAANYSKFYHDVLGYPTLTAYDDIIKTATDGGLTTTMNWDVAKSLPLLPLIVFYGLWPVWGAPMYGEVRGANSVKKVFISTMMANAPLNILAILVFTGAWKAIRFEFYQAMNWGWWMKAGPGALMPPSIPLLVYFITGMGVGSAILTAFILIGNTWAWIHTNGSGNGYLIVTRGMFAMSFDRMLPSWFAKLSTRYQVPLISMVWTAIVAAILGYLYAYNIAGFSAAFLDATFTLLIIFMVTAICVIVLPYTKRELWESSPASKYTWLFQLSSVIFLIYGAVIFYYWVVDPLYGVNSVVSAYFLICLYVVGAIVYYAFKFYRKQQGIEISKIFQEIPAE
jgi:amino acid transporter